MLHYFPAAILVSHRGTPTWRHHTRLRNFAWDNAQAWNLENCLLYSSSIISQFLDFIHWMVFDFNFYCVTVKTLYWMPREEASTIQFIWCSIWKRGDSNFWSGRKWAFHPWIPFTTCSVNSQRKPTKSLKFAIWSRKSFVTSKKLKWKASFQIRQKAWELV